LCDRGRDAEAAVARIAASPARWEPGTDAAYHPSSGWKILGAIVERVDGRPIDRYVREEVFAPLGIENMRLGIPQEEQSTLGDRIAPVFWRGHVLPVVDADGSLQMVPYKVDQFHNEPHFVAKVEPGGGMRGPARELGHFYESLLGMGPSVLDPRTVENGKPPADPDEAFIEMMIPHHQGAVAMIGRFLDTTKRPELQQLARNIIRSQEREIAQMESWKRSWGAGSK